MHTQRTPLLMRTAIQQLPSSFSTTNVYIARHKHIHVLPPTHFSKDTMRQTESKGEKHFWSLV